MALAGSGCQKPTPPLIRIAFPPWLGYGLFHLAKEGDFFKKEGADVHLVHQHSVADSRRALERGQVDAICCTLVESLLSSQVMKQPPTILGVIDSSVGGDQLLVKASKQKELGKTEIRVGLESAGNDIYLLHLALKKLGLDAETVKPVYLSHADMRLAVNSNQVDAVVTYPPESFEFLKSPGWVKVFDTSQSPGEILDVVLVSEKSLAQSRRSWLKVFKALERARQWREDNPDQALEILARVYGISKTEVIDAEKGILFYQAKDQRQFLEGNVTLKQKLEDTCSALANMGSNIKCAKKLPKINLDFQLGGSNKP